MIVCERLRFRGCHPGPSNKIQITCKFRNELIINLYLKRKKKRFYDVKLVCERKSLTTKEYYTSFDASFLRSNIGTLFDETRTVHPKKTEEEEEKPRGIFAHP